MADSERKKGPISLVTKEMHIKTIRYCFTSIGLASKVITGILIHCCWEWK